MTDDAVHELAAAILQRAWDDLGLCPKRHWRCRADCRRVTVAPWCDVAAFWRSDWAGALCRELGIDHDAAVCAARKKVV